MIRNVRNVPEQFETIVQPEENSDLGKDQPR